MEQVRHLSDPDSECLLQLCEPLVLALLYHYEIGRGEGSLPVPQQALLAVCFAFYRIFAGFDSPHSIPALAVLQ